MSLRWTRRLRAYDSGSAGPGRFRPTRETGSDVRWATGSTKAPDVRWATGPTKAPDVRWAIRLPTAVRTEPDAPTACAKTAPASSVPQAVACWTRPTVWPGARARGA